MRPSSPQPSLRTPSEFDIEGTHLLFKHPTPKPSRLHTFAAGVIEALQGLARIGHQVLLVSDHERGVVRVEALSCLLLNDMKIFSFINGSDDRTSIL